jgi:peptidoglycan/LPS O-acetylase OafA/YrhL
LRLDIEGLRAVAVLLVLCFHAELGPFTGGYIGVDVFFVVSGFLITSLLLSELQRTGSIKLARFWSRRARRLLPASTLVIVTTLLAGSAVLDPLSLTGLAREGLAAATFTINIVLAWRGNDYLAADLAPSPLLHFWSLALEEQFYLVWPLLLQLVAGYRHHRRAAVAALIVVAWPISFAAAMVLTPRNQPWAFFSLSTRAWELLTGAALAFLVLHAQRLPAVMRGAMSWAGLAVIVAAAVQFDLATRFPGPAALVPVLATAAVILGGPLLGRGPVGLLNLRPMTWVGQRSYSIYLWHWPALVLVAAELGPLAAWERLATLLASVAIAAVTYRILENPVRHWKWLAAQARRGLLMASGLITASVGTAAAVVVTAPPLVGNGSAAAPVIITAVPAAPIVTPVSAAPAATDERVPDTTARNVERTPIRDPDAAASDTASAPVPTSVPAQTAPPTTLGPGPDELAVLNEPQLLAGLQTEAAPASLRPSVRGARADLPAIYHDGCHLDAAVTMPGPCTFGDPASSTTVVLFGDSHAAQWFPALAQLADQHHWRLLVLTKKGCPTASISVFSPMVNRELRECDTWRLNVAARLAAEQPDLLLMSSYRYRQTGAWAGIDGNRAWQEGLSTTLAAYRPLARRVLILGDTPTPARDVPACVSAHLGRVSACVNARAEAVRDDRLGVEQEVATAYDATFVSTSNWLCSATACPVVVGDILVYRDANHLTATAAAWLAPYLDAAIAPLLS